MFCSLSEIRIFQLPRYSSIMIFKLLKNNNTKKCARDQHKLIREQERETSRFFD